MSIEALALVSGEGAEEGVVDIALLLASLTIMPLVAVAELKVATDRALPALAAEARETVACSYLSLTVLAGLLARWALGWWRLDAFAALTMVPWLVRGGSTASAATRASTELRSVGAAGAGGAFSTVRRRPATRPGSGDRDDFPTMLRNGLYLSFPQRGRPCAGHLSSRRRKRRAACLLRRSLSIESRRFPSRSMAR